MATDLTQRSPVVDELLDGPGNPQGDRLDGLGAISLHDRNLLAAWQQGIRLGQEAIGQILRGGAGPLGERESS